MFVTRSLNNARNYFLAFLNHAIFDNGVLRDGPIFLVLDCEADFGLAFDLTLAAKFLALSLVFFAADFVAAAAFEAVAFAFAGVFLAAALAFAGAALTAFLAATDALSSFLAAAATFFAIAAWMPAFTSLAAPAAATFDTVSNLASTSFFAVAAPTPGIAVNLLALEPLVPVAMVSPCLGR